MLIRLAKLTLRGFRSISELKDFEPGPINVLIGANGAGKSNLLSFFRLLAWATAGSGNLQEHVALLGGAGNILHDGPSRTHGLEAQLTFEVEGRIYEYEFRLSHAAGDSFIFSRERLRATDLGGENTRPPWKDLGAGHREARIVQEAACENTLARVIHGVMRTCAAYQFHDTSPTARIRGKWHKDDNRKLRLDGANLAPVLLRLREDEPKYYASIVETIRQILPFFADFELRTEHDHLLLRWRERNSDMEFSVAQASDGMLRTMALITLLLQPPDDLPGVLILDEPELGLHPYAINIVAGLLRSASEHVQVIVATQSSTFVDYFDPDEIVVVDRKGRESSFTRLEADKLSDWLEEYSIAELWEKNVIGGRPAR